MRDTSEQSKPPSRGGPQSVGRIMSILDCLVGAADGATLSELAVDTGAPKTSLVGLLAGLTEEGCLLRHETGRYVLGPRFISLAMRATAGRELMMITRPVLVDLAGQTGETAVLATLAPDADLATYLDKVESANPIRYAVTVGERRDLYCTAAGKVLLAGFDPARFKAYLKTTLRQRFTATTITSVKDLTAEMARIREHGIARTKAERIEGASGLAAPIHAAGSDTIAALLIAGPSERIHGNSAATETLLKAAAAECTRLAGGGENSNQNIGTEQNT